MNGECAELAERSEDMAAWVGAFAPASVSNVGPGFDCFGFALDAPGDTVHVRAATDPGIRIVEIAARGAALPTDPARNTAGVAAAALWNAHPEIAAAHGLEMRIEKGLPACSGLGSSAASAVAGAHATMQLLGRLAGIPFDRERVLDAALAGEGMASGQRHADNVAPSLLGGFTIVLSADPPRIERLEPALACRVAVVLPDMEIATDTARSVLPARVPLADAVGNWSRAAALVLGLVRGDRDLVSRALVDAVVEPHRARLIPGYDAARRAAREVGAFACAISGSGPALFALADTEADACAAGSAMRDVFRDHDLESTVTVSGISPAGARPS